MNKVSFILVLILFSSCGQVENKSDKTISKSKDTLVELVKKDTIIVMSREDSISFYDKKVKNLDDCFVFFNRYKNEPDFLSSLNLLEFRTGYHQLKYIDKTTSSSFLLVYSYTIEMEEGRINLVLCDSSGKILDRKTFSQIYETVSIEKTTENLYRIYGKNTHETYGQSDNIRNTGLDNNNDFDFYVNTYKNDTIQIGN